MGLSNSFSYSVTQTDIISVAMLNTGALGEGETPTASEFNDCSRLLNLMVKQWMGKRDFAPGLKMWTRARGDLFLSSSKGVYGLGPSGDNWAAGVTAIPGANFGADTLTGTTASGSAVLNVATIGNYTQGDFIVVQTGGDIFSSTVASVGATTVTMNNVLPAGITAGVGGLVWNFTVKGQLPDSILTCVLRDSTGNDYDVNRMTLEDYEHLPNKAQPQYLGDPTAFYYEKQIGSQLITPVITGPGMLYLDVGGCQDVTKHLHIVYYRPVMDFVNPGDNPEYPQEWYRALCWGLTREIAPMFDAEWTDDMQANYTEAMSFAKQGDAETTSLYFQPESESWPA